MSVFNEQELIQFWKDANSYQSIDVPCFDIEEFKDNWIRDKIGHEALAQANDDETGEKQCNLPVVTRSYSYGELKTAFEQARCNDHSFEDWFDFNYG